MQRNSLVTDRKRPALLQVAVYRADLPTTQLAGFDFRRQRLVTAKCAYVRHVARPTEGLLMKREQNQNAISTPSHGGCLRR